MSLKAPLVAYVVAVPNVLAVCRDLTELVTRTS